MAFSDVQLTTMRDKLQLPADADEAAIVDAVTTVVEESLEERASSQGVPEGHVVVPEVRLHDLEEAAKQGVAAAQTLHVQAREAFLNENKAKFPAKSRAKWAERYDKDPEATRELLSGAEDLVPTAEIGHEVDSDDESGDPVATVRETPAYKNWRM